MGVKVREKPTGSGNWWIFINHNGQRKSKKVGKDKKLAHDVAEKIKAKLVLGELKVEKVNEKIPTFKEYAELWLSLPHDWKESTRENYEHNMQLHIFPEFGKRKIDEFKRKDLKVFFDKLLSNGMSTAIAKTLKTLINGVLSNALDSEMIEVNPVFDLKMTGKKTDFEIEPLTEAEVEKFLEQAKKLFDGIYYPPFLCALRTGARLGEIKALKWDDIDFEKRLIEVKRSCRRGRITGTKNKKRRRVDMTPYLAETLKILRTEQKKDALKNGRPVPEWVFVDTKGRMLTRNVVQHALRQCLKRAKMRKIRIHDLRHSYSTIRLLRGHNVGDVSYQLGHSSIKITYDTYGHWIPGKFKSEVDDLDNMHPNAPYAHPETIAGQNI